MDKEAGTELGGKAAGINKSSTNRTDSLSSLQMLIFACVAAGLILAVGGLVCILRRQWTKRQRRHRNNQTGAETPPLHFVRIPRDESSESLPVLANADPRSPRPIESVRPLTQAASSSSPTTSGSYDLISYGPILPKQDTKDAGAKSAENGGQKIQCVYYFANDSHVKVEGDYKGMFANGSMDNSVIYQRRASDHKTDVPVRGPNAVNINIQPAMAGTADRHDPHENLTETAENLHSGAPETIYSAEGTAHPVQEVGDSRPSPIKPMSGAGCNTIPKRP